MGGTVLCTFVDCYTPITILRFSSLTSRCTRRQVRARPVLVFRRCLSASQLCRGFSSFGDDFGACVAFVGRNSCTPSCCPLSLVTPLATPLFAPALNRCRSFVEGLNIERSRFSFHLPYSRQLLEVFEQSVGLTFSIPVPSSTLIFNHRDKKVWERGVWRHSKGKEAGNLKLDTIKRRIMDCSSRASGDQPASVLPAVKVWTGGPKFSFCPGCGGVVEQRVPAGEHEMRAVCTVCGAVHYQNPKMVVGCLIEHDNQVLLCKRNIDPSHGLWTLPAGYMEMGESAAEGAARETWEEAQADVQIVGLFAHLDIPLIGQSYIIFRARLKSPHFSPGPESLECALFKLNEIPFESIAFSSIRVALEMYVEDMKAGAIRVHHGVIDKRPGASPSDPSGYVVRNHLSM